MSEPTNEKVTAAIAILLEAGPVTITHGEFNRRSFLEAFVLSAGQGVAITPEDIMEYGAITEREFPIILNEYLTEGIIVKADNLFGIEMYKLNLTTN